MFLWLTFFALIGACVGSFLNVVVYRMPAGLSIVRPPSSCPRCGHRLAAYDNVPILGWLWLRGCCRYCKNPISVQYPIVEAITAVLFGGWFYLVYMTGLHPGFSGPGPGATWPIFLAFLTLLAVLLASTLIDARYFIIPISLPWTAAVAGLVLFPLAVGLFPGQAVKTVHLPDDQMSERNRLEAVRPQAYRDSAPVRLAVRNRKVGSVEVTAAPIVSARTAWTALAGALGLGLAILLLWWRILPYSFAQEITAETKVPEGSKYDPSQWPQHPHPRREIAKECLFLAFPVVAAVIGSWLGPSELAPAGRVLGGAIFGLLIGGGVVWLVRILGTLGFGREAMGLGDVHLMAGVGAVTGWQVPLVAFFLAAFIGLAWAALSLGMNVMFKQRFKAIPYGPHLAVATVIACVFREGIVFWLATYFGRFGVVAGLNS